MVKALARWVLGLDKDNIPKPVIVERVVYRQAGTAPEADPMAGWQ
jgi:hypothetical protein